MKIIFATLHVRKSAQAEPLAAACLAAALSPELRARTELLSFFPEDTEEQIRREILARRPELVAFPLYVWNRTFLLQLSRRLRQADPSLRLVAGGPEATADPLGVLAEGNLDGVVNGEGEAVFAELAAALARGENPAGQPGLLWQSSRGPVNGPEAPPPDLRQLPSPWLGGVLSATPGSGILWETSRGCSFGCDFCFEGRSGRGVRVVPPERLKAELDLFAQAGVAQAWILDSSFNYPPERGKDLLRLLVDRAPHIHFHLEAKAEFLDREMVRLFSRLRCSVQLGFQSADPKVLRLLHRSLDLDLFSRKINLINAEGVTFGLDLIYGLPGDNYQGFRASLDVALGFAPNTVDIFPLAVLPGTPLHHRREQFGLRAQTAPPYEIIDSPTFSAADLARCRRLAAAANLFYNLGRAVAFFPALLGAVDLKPSDFLAGFADWAVDNGKLTEALLERLEEWNPAQILPLQEGYAEYLLRRNGKSDLLPAALDLIRYHFHYAETLLGEETTPAGAVRERNLWDSPCRLNPRVKLVPFVYEVLDLQDTGDIDLEEFVALFRPLGSVALFLRRGDQVICESLEENFLKLLQSCNGEKSPQDIFAGSISQREGEEIVEFAVSEGLLTPPTEN